MAEAQSTSCETRTGFLLSRQWKDSQQGMELVYWISTDAGPARIRITGERAVCFIPRNTNITDTALIDERKPLALKSLQDEPVDALYFQQQRHLTAWLAAAPEHRAVAMEADIKPSERFLMERFIHSGISVEGDWQWARDHWQIHNPICKAAEIDPELNLLSLDIETSGARGSDLYAIGVATTTERHVFLVSDHRALSPFEGFTLHNYPGEAATLTAFFDWLKQSNPDVIIGWNLIDFDLDFLADCCRRHKIPFSMGRGNDQAAILQPMRSGQPRIARIPGRPVLDGIDLLRAAFWNFESFTLENVAQELLGEGKLIHQGGQDKIAEIQRQYHEAPLELARYNIQDCILVLRIFEKTQLLPFAIQRARMTGLSIDRLGGSVAAFDHLYLPRLHRRGRVALSLEQVSNGQNSPGGYVMNSQPGLYDNVLVLDFKSLYPSIIRTFLIDPLGLVEPGDNPVQGFRNATFGRHAPILPELIEHLWELRDEAKKTANQPLSQAIKIIMNSFYGVLGSRGCRFFDPRLASSITMRGHEIITRSRDWIESQGYRVIYGDTDSVFVLLGENCNETEAERIGKQLAKNLNHWWQHTLQQEHQITSQLEIEFETHFLRFLMPRVRGGESGSKKRYAGTIHKTDGSVTPIFKGLETVRSDWTPLAQAFQRELYRRIFAREPYEDYCKQTVIALFAGEKDHQLRYRKRLRRKLGDYVKNIPPHVQAARKHPNPGKSIDYIITITGPQPEVDIQSPPDYQHYFEKQLEPVADSILQFTGTSLAEICDQQMRLF